MVAARVVVTDELGPRFPSLQHRNSGKSLAGTRRNSLIRSRIRTLSTAATRRHFSAEDKVVSASTQRALCTASDTIVAILVFLHVPSANLKACYYQIVADALERDQVYGLTDETTIGQLANI